MAFIIAFAVFALIVGLVFVFGFAVVIVETFRRTKNNKQFNTNSGDYWDEPSGATYITLPNGDRRLN